MRTHYKIGIIITNAELYWILLGLRVKVYYVISRADGCCRHVAATLFEIQRYQNDREQLSVTSGSCIWTPKAGPSTGAVKAIGLKVGRDDMDDSHSDMNDVDDENVIGDKPSVASFMETVKQHFPDACILDTYEVREKIPAKVPTLDVLTPQNLVDIFIAGHDCIESDNCTDTCLDELEQCLTYAPEDILKIEKATRGQAENENWHVMRNRIVTASKFKLVCHSTNETKTAINLLTGRSFNPDYPPVHIRFGQDFESTARDRFLKAHKYHHRSCHIDLVGLYMHPDYPFLGASPDGILCCKDCGKSLVEIKCLSSKRNFSPSTALLLNNVCIRKQDDTIAINPKHAYYYQIQGQMAMTGIKLSHLVGYTLKGIYAVQVPFDQRFWDTLSEKLRQFYRCAYYPLLHVRSSHYH